MVRCPFCGGSGVTRGKKGILFRERPQVCPKCGGTGFIRREFVM
jgi:DnaJ-class molecular chaperone